MQKGFFIDEIAENHVIGSRLLSAPHPNTSKSNDLWSLAFSPQHTQPENPTALPATTLPGGAWNWQSPRAFCLPALPRL
jgi:hypothetical protein